jgi:hypothetical protein
MITRQSRTVPVEGPNAKVELELADEQYALFRVDGVDVFKVELLPSPERVARKIAKVLAAKDISPQLCSFIVTLFEDWGVRSPSKRIAIE